MAYILSREDWPSDKAEVAKELWFNLWSKRMAPYARLMPGDTLYLYSSDKQKVLWRSRIEDVARYEYDSKAGVLDWLEERFSRPVDRSHPYVRTASDSGYSLAYTIGEPSEKLDLPRPDDVAIPQHGWLEITGVDILHWLELEEAPAEPSIGDIIGQDVMSDDLDGMLRRLSEIMSDVEFKKRKRVVSQAIRGDTAIVQLLKKRYGSKCQFPGCEAVIEKKGGGKYVEVHHVLPVAEGGRSVIGNLLVLCPNHHAEFQHGDLQLQERSTQRIAGTLNGKEFAIPCVGDGD